MPGDFRISKITVAINGGAGSPPDYNVHFVSTADQLPATMTAVLTQFKNFYDAVKAWFPNGQIFTIGAQVLDMETTPPTVLAVPPQTVTGTDFSGYCPPQCAVVVSWKTILASRSGRGRSYIGPVGRAGETTNGTPTPAFATALQTAANGLISGLTPVPAAKVLYNPATAAFAGVTSAVVRGGSFHTQRRRAVK
mgnify:CR=1 FL=1|jgi:hypothetical protein